MNRWYNKFVNDGADGFCAEQIKAVDYLYDKFYRFIAVLIVIISGKSNIS